LTDLITAQNISKCLEYSEDSERLKKVIYSLQVKTKLVGYDKYFEDDKEPRNIYEVRIKRGNRSIGFRFGDSIANTQEGNEPDLYSVLSTISLEYEAPATFEDFCSEFGYDRDSRKAEKSFKGLKRMSEKLHKIFTDDDLYSNGISVFPH